MRQGLHTCLYCCYDSYCKGTNFFSIMYRLATVFGLASVHSPHWVCRVRPLMKRNPIALHRETFIQTNRQEPLHVEILLAQRVTCNEFAFLMEEGEDLLIEKPHVCKASLIGMTSQVMRQEDIIK